MIAMSDKLIDFIKYILGENPDNIVYVSENNLTEVLEFIEKNHSKMESLETMEDILDFTFGDTWRKIRESVLSHRFSSDMNNRFNDMMLKLKPEDIKTEIIKPSKLEPEDIKTEFIKKEFVPIIKSEDINSVGMPPINITPVDITPEIMNDSNINNTNINETKNTSHYWTMKKMDDTDIDEAIENMSDSNINGAFNEMSNTNLDETKDSMNNTSDEEYSSDDEDRFGAPFKNMNNTNIEESEILESKEFHDPEADRRTAALKDAKIKIELPLTKEKFLEKMKEIDKNRNEDEELKELEQLKTILEESYKKGIGTHESGGGDKYEMVNHPTHYNSSSVETIEKMVRIWGKEQTAMWCEMTAFKYRERIGLKPDNSLEQEMGKIKWYESKARELRKSLKIDGMRIQSKRT